MSFKKFLVLLAALSFVLGLSAYAIEVSDPSDILLVPKFWVLFGFLLVLTIMAFAVASIGNKRGGENSIQIIMAVTTIKLLLCMSLVLVYLLKFKVNGLVFVVEFFSLYFSFTSFEVYALLCNLRHQNKT